MKQYGSFDETNLGANLELSFGDQTVATTGAPDGHRNARAFFGLTIFPGEVEAIFYSPNASSPSFGESGGVPWLTIGLVQESTPTNVYLGETADAWGWNPGTGHIYNGGAVVATITGANPGDYCNSVIDPRSGSWSLYVNKSVIGSVAIGAGLTWAHAISLGGDAGDRAIYVNPGITPIRFPVIQVNPGYWRALSVIAPILLATQPYITQAADALPLTKYAGDVDRMQTPPRINRGVNVWPWGTSRPPQLQTAQAQVSISILDPDGLYAALLSADVRDIRVPIQRVEKNGSLASSENCFVGIVDAVHAPSDQTKELQITDITVLLQQPLNRPLFPPTADPSVAGKPMGKSLSVCRNYAPIPYVLSSSPSFECDYRGVSAFGINRIQGKPIALGTDYNVLPDATGVTTLVEPAGKFTIESTSTGAAYNPAGTDVLGGIGVFSLSTPTAKGQPAGWNGPSPLGVTDQWQLVGGKLQQLNQYWEPGIIGLATDAAFILDGHSYLVQVTVDQVPSYGVGWADGVRVYAPAAGLYVGFASGDPDRWWDIAGASYQFLHAPGVYTFTIFNWSGGDLPLGIGIDATPYQGGVLIVSDIKMQALPDVAENMPLDALGLDACLRDLMVYSGPLSDADYDTASARAIDAATGYGYGIHIEATNNPLIQDVVKQFLDSICGDKFPNRNGQVSVFRLIAPEDVADEDLAGELTVTDFQGYLTPYPDNAEGLTTRLNGCPNYSPYTASDFGTVSLDDVPYAVRQKLELAYQWTALSGVPLAPRYAAANSAPPQATLFDRQADGVAEAARVCGFYEDDRAFYVGTVFTPLGRQLEIGEVYEVTYPLPGLETGRKLLVVGVNDQPSEELSEIIFWGLQT